MWNFFGRFVQKQKKCYNVSTYATRETLNGIHRNKNKQCVAQHTVNEEKSPLLPCRGLRLHQETDCSSYISWASANRASR